MASSSTTKHIVIDWSSPPTHSFVQLSLTPMPQKDSNNYVQVFEQEVILTTKDILHLDIDDILSPSSFTAPQPRRKNFPFFVSFKKTHVIKTQYTGFNKIYNSGRSKSFFFEIVDCNPGTNDIHLKIHTNDYRMSTTPISFNSTSWVPNAKFQISKALQVLKKEVVKPGGTSNVASKLDAAKTSNFLLLPSQTINKRIQHIRFQDIKPYPEKSGLNFSTPYDHKYKKRLKSTEQISKSKEITIEPQVMASPTMTDSERKIADAKESGWDPTFYYNKMKKINNLMNWSDKFHKDRINFIKQYNNIAMNHPKMNTPDDGQSKKKNNKLTLEDKMRTLYARFPGLIIPNNRKCT
ncbi:hypothetical protein C1646_664046 [Rhizophagus diaphanus]|nr:hypothetical protein C1646_664046 [Rhizophagus diaphanus] [Rhizophagus sp. MUCL 43196]